MPRILLCLGLACLAAFAADALPAQPGGDSTATEAHIRGLVTDASGAALEGARIRARPRDALVTPFNSLRSASTTSASDGSFRVEGVVHGHAYRLIAQAAGYASALLDLPPLEPGTTIDPVHLVLGPGRQVHGTTVDTEGNPVAEANVSLLWPLDQSDYRSPFETPAATTRTNEQGAFVFSTVAPGDYALRLRHPGYADRPPAEIDVPAGDANLDLGDLTLVSGGTIRGVVLGADGEPVAGARKRAQARNQFGRTARTATADANGRFRLEGLSTDLVDLGVRGAGYPLLTRPGVRVDREDPILIELLHGGIVTGRVVDAGGNGAAGVPVRLRREHDRRSGGSPVLWGPRDSFPRRVTDAEGRFRFDDVPSGNWSAEARKGTEAAKVDEFELTPGAEREIELVLGTADRLAVTVTTPPGEPVAGATVLIRSGGENRLSGYGQTNGSGEAQIDISPGPATVEVEHERLGDESRQVELSPGANELRIELQAIAEIAGTVRSHDGAALALATIEAVTEHSFDTEFRQLNTVSDHDGAFRVTGGEPLAGARLGIAGQSAQTDGEGYFSLEGLEPGRTQVRISRPDFGSSQYQAIDIESDLEGVRIELEAAAATIAGVVVNAATGEPIYLAHLIAADAATIDAIAAGGAGASFVGTSFSFSQPQGEFELELRANADHVRVTHDGYESTQIPLNIAPGEHREGLVIEMRPEASGAPNQ